MMPSSKELYGWCQKKKSRSLWFSGCLPGLPNGSAVKNRLQCSRRGFNPWVGKIPWRRAWQTTPVFLPGESHGQRGLEGYSPWSHKESDSTEVTEQDTPPWGRSD